MFISKHITAIRFAAILTIFCLSIIGVNSCYEVGPEIDLIEPQRKVLIEEFTGVQCVNCPEGAQKIEDLLEIHGDNLVVLSIHTGFFSMPLNSSNFDFRTPEGSQIDNMIGPVTAYPSGSVNRRLFSGENSRVLHSGKWAGYILQELSRLSLLNINLNLNYDSDTRIMDLESELIFFGDLAGPIHISVAIAENNISDAQVAPGGLDNSYVHRHVLRGLLTSFNGDPLSEHSLAASPILKTFSTSISEEWNDQEIEIIVFVHRPGPNFEVLQVEKALLME